MELLKQGATMHNDFKQGLITKEETIQRLEKWWDEVTEASNISENMMFNLMMMYRTISDLLQRQCEVGL